MQKILSLTSYHLFILCGVLIFLCICCKKPAEAKQELKSVINTAHLDHLYEEIKMGDDTVGIIHIYAEAPDYKWIGDEDEGMTCMDDIARAAIFYFNEYSRTDDKEYYRKARMLIKSVLALQAENGYYYNFIWPDGSINKDGITSKPEPSWWAWRAWWSLHYANSFIAPNDTLSPKIRQQKDKLLHNVLTEKSFRSVSTDTAFGFVIPAWLPKGSGTDQASIILLMLANEYRLRPDTILDDSIRDLAMHLADGIRMMQVRSPGALEDGAFLSWENLWHAYGNIQSYSLWTVGHAYKDTVLIQAAKYEIDHFYPALQQAGGLEHFWLKRKGNQITRYDEKQFNQIAYGQSPIIYGALTAFVYSTKEEKRYEDMAKETAMWFFGKNPAGVRMYDPSTGRCFDGIKSATEVNKNAGAESTIEALLSLQALEMYDIYYDEKTNTFITIEE